MNKTELVDIIASSCGVTKADTNRVLDAFRETLIDTLKKGGEIALPGIGTFCTGHRSARTGRNPQTGAVIQIKASRVAKFRAAKALKEAAQKG